MTNLDISFGYWRGLALFYRYYVMMSILQQQKQSITHLLNMVSLIKKYCIAVLVMVLVQTSAFTQDLAHTVYTFEDGMPYTNTYCVEQDTLGYIWAITDYGLSRYNGETFTNFNLSNGFPDRGGFHIYKDRKNVMWFLPFNGKVCYYNGKTFVVPKCVDTEKFEPVSWVTEDSQGNICFLTRQGSIIVLYPDGSTKRYSIPSGNSFCFIEQTPGTFLILLDDRMMWLDTKTGSMGYIKEFTNNAWQAYYPRMTMLRNGRLLLTTSNGVFEVLKNRSFKQLITANENYGGNNEIYNIYEEKNGDVWMPTKKGLVKYDKNLNVKTRKMYFANQHIFTVIRDNEDNIWMATPWGLVKVFSEGARYVTKANYPASDNIVKAVDDGEGGIWAINLEGIVYRYSKNGGVAEFKDHANGVPDAFFFKKLDASEILINSSRKTVVFNIKNKTAKQELPITNITFLLKHSDTTFYIDLGGVGYFEGSKKKKIADSTTGWNSSIFPRAFARDRERNIWIGCEKQGLIKLTPDGAMKKMRDKYPVCGIGVSSLHVCENGAVLTATSSNILYCFHNGLLQQYLLDGPADNRIRGITVKGDSVLWVATSNGAYKFSISEKGVLHKIFHYTVNNSLISNDVNDVVDNGERVYFATRRGISLIYQSLYKLKEINPKVLIDKFAVGDIIGSFDSEKVIEVGYKNNFFSINTETSTYSWGKIKYKYKLEPLDTAWEYSLSNNIKYSSLPPGKYVFRIKAASIFGNESIHERQIVFYIKKPYWQTVWFWVLVVAAVSAMVYAGVRYRLNAVRREASLQKGLVEAQLKALRLQMNPHFIFNTLQSIQDFIITKQNKLAVIYLSKFSKLIRSALDYSKQNFITLQEDADMLNLYVELEKARFDGKLEFEEQIDGSIDAERVLIPPMMIQPFIENAIKHGIGPRGEGKIKFIVTKSSTHLHIEVTDNGVGRMAAYKTSQLKAKHKSTGINQTIDRLEMLFANYGLNGANVQINDLFDNQSPAGTQVLIKIPYANG